MANPLTAAITDSVLRRLADKQTYQRGLDYFTHSHVVSLAESNAGASAVVRGEQDYTVELTADEGVLEFSCDCPTGSDGAFCKHCVAAALAWLERPAAQTKSAHRGKAKQMTLADAGKVLRGEDKDEIVRLVLEWAKGDKILRQNLVLYAARRISPETGAAAVARAFERAARVPGFTGYFEARGWARGVDRAIDGIAQLLEDGQAAAVIELCESALQQLVGAVESIDDSDGHFAGLRDRLQDIHFQACLEARPDPAALAERLLHFELHAGFDVFYNAVTQYADILGPKGMEAYRKLAEAVWAKVPAQKADDGDSGWGARFRITQIMKSLAKASGDIEQRVAVISRDLSSAYSYLQVCEVYREAGLHDQALAWAEKGLQAFPEKTDTRLREFAAAEYHRRERHGEAMQLMWAEFCGQPLLSNFEKLHHHAEQAGEWPEWRERALAEIRRRIAKAKADSHGKRRFPWMLAVDHSALVEIFLYEKKTGEAWREAQAGGCADRFWLRLAGLREKDHPEDAAAVYWKQAEAEVARIRNGAYENAVDMLVKTAAVMRRLGQGAEFVRRLETLRTQYKAKRNFMKLVEQNRKVLYLS